MYTYSLQYLRHLDNSTRHSNSSLCTLFRKDFVIWFRCVVPLFSLDKPDKCRNRLLQVRLSKRILELFWSHTCLTSFYKISITCKYKTDTMYQIQTHTNFNETESCIQSQAHFLVESWMDDVSVIWGVRLDAQTLVLLSLLELNSPCLPHRQLLLGWQRLIPSENRQRWMGKMGYRFQVDNHCPYPLQDLPNWFQCLLDRIARIHSWRYLVLNTGEYFFSHFKCSLLVGSYGNSSQVIVQKFLSLGQQQRPSCQRNFQVADCKVLI